MISIEVGDEMELYQMSNQIFKDISQWIYQEIGLKLTEKKKAMVKARLTKRLIELKVSSFEEYYQLASGCESEKCKLINLLTTNVTKFFREGYHFQFLEEVLLPKIRSNYKQDKIRVWSAGCSSGEEAYSIAIVLNEFFGEEWDIKILATDVNTEVLKKGARGIYSCCELKKLSPMLVDKYFKIIKSSDKRYYQVRDKLRKQVIFKRLNLNQTKSYQINSKLDLIFCRNVFIYFDDNVKQEVLNFFYNNLKNRQYLFLGNSDSIDHIVQDNQKWKLLYPTTYQKL